MHGDGATTFRVWAPEASQVDLLLTPGASGQPVRRPMEPLTDGWFGLRTAATHGDDYGFSLDGGDLRPDPASRWQPQGVHAPSRVFDPRTFAWSADEAVWRAPDLAGAVIYELHVGTFTAERTLDAAIPHLPELARLGITHVELMPLNAFNGEHGWGYDGVGWMAVHEPYGGPAALARFVDAAHRSGLAVIVDAVYNHLGPSGNYLPEFGPYLTDRYRTPWGPCLNLDGPASDPVRALILQSALQWLTLYHADALRLDAVHGLIDTSAVHILAELSDAVAARSVTLRRPLRLIAESDRNDPLTITPRALGGQGLDAQWVDDLHHAIHVTVTGEQDGYYVDYDGLAQVAAAFTEGFVFNGRYSRYRRRTVGAPLAETPGWRLITCIQNHDQVGNRALGERLPTLVEPSLVRVAVALLCVSPTTPMLFMGEEYDERAPFQYFTSHPEPDLAEAVRTGRREEFTAFAAFAGSGVPDPQAPETLQRSTLDRRRAQTPAGRARRRLWQDLLALRRTRPALGNGRRDLIEIVEVGGDRLIVRRGDPGAPDVLVVANLAISTRTISLPDGAWQPVLSTDDLKYGGGSDPAAGEGRIRYVDVAAQSVMIFDGPALV